MGKIIKNGISYAGVGAEGKSAYQTWLDLGNTGTEQDFLNSLGGKPYTSLEDLGLTAPVTVGEIFNAMDDNTTAMIGCEDRANHIIDVPTSYGVLTIKKKNNSRFSIEYQNSLGGSATDVRRWIGTVKGTDGSGLYWKELQATNGEIITSDTITKYGTEILKYPIGIWRINSVNIGKQFTDLPYAEMAGVIEIDSIQPNKSPYEHAYGYRNYTFRDALNNTVYTRSLNSGETIGTLDRDSGWCTTGSHIYKLTQMYLTTNATIQEVIDAVPIGSTAILRTDEFANWSTLFNDIQWGYFKVEKTVNGLSNIELQEVITPNRRYFGSQSSGKFSAWQQMITENSKTDPYSCSGYKALTGTEDLFTLPCGHYVSEKANTTYNYPVTDSDKVTAHIYILGHLNESANNKGYRMILYFDNKGRTYNVNEWWGTFNSWNRLDLETRVNELFQSVSDGKTLVANAITGKGVSTATNATFATMATNIGKISGGKEETKSLIVTSSSTGTEALKFTFSANVIAVKQIVAPSDSCRILPQTSKNMFTITGKELIVHVTGSGTWKVTALIEK